MSSMIKKQVGRHKKQDPLKKLQAINKVLKKLGCSFKPDNSNTVYRKIVGRT